MQVGGGDQFQIFLNDGGAMGVDIGAGGGARPRQLGVRGNQKRGRQDSG